MPGSPEPCRRNPPPAPRDKSVTGPNEDGNVLVLRDPFISDAYSVESWGPMETIDDFVKKALARIPVDRNAADKGQEEGCGTSCG